MAKDYFQDIIPPTARKRTSAGTRKVAAKAASKPKPELEEDIKVNIVDTTADTDDLIEDVGLAHAEEHVEPEAPERSIRNISLSSRPRPTPPPAHRTGSPILSTIPIRPASRGSRMWLWVVVAILLLVLGLFLLLSFRPATVTVTPHSQAVVFSTTTANFTAHPADTAASGTLAYTVRTITLEDTEVVPAQSGTTHVETKASGSLTVYNDYSTDPVRLVATTRFQTADGLVYRTPTDISIPGKTSAGPGQVTVQVTADSAGEKYNIAEGTKLTLPGLQKNVPMFKGVTAQAARAFDGGFSGERAATDPAARAAAASAIRTRLLTAATEKATTEAGDENIIFLSLLRASYQSLPDTDVTGGVGIHERITLTAPVFAATSLAQEIALHVADDVTPGQIRIVPGEGFAATSLDAASSTLGTSAFAIQLSGNAFLVWDVDTAALANALKSKDQAAFQAIIKNFPAVATAKARVEPFWSKKFPSQVENIRIVVEEPVLSPASAE